MSDRINIDPPLTPWEQVNRVMEEAAQIEKLAALYREGGRGHREALEMALAAWRRAKEDQPCQP